MDSRFRLACLLLLLSLFSCTRIPPSLPEATLLAPVLPASPATPTTLPSPSPTALPPTSTAPALALSPTPVEENKENPPAVRYSSWEHVLALAWDPSGQVLAAAAGQNVHLYAYPSLEELHLLPAGASANSIVFLDMGYGDKPAGGILALALKNGSIQIWDAANGQRLCEFQAHRKDASSLAFSPTALLLASTGADAMVRLWDLTPLLLEGNCELAPAAEMIGGAQAVPAIDFSPDGSTVASIDLKLIRLREVASQRLVRTFQAGASMLALAFSPDGLLLASGEMDNIVRLWEVESGDEVSSLAPPDGTSQPAFIWKLAFHPQSQALAAASSDGSIYLWQILPGGLGSDLHILVGHARAVSSLDFSPNGEVLASGGLDGAVRLWSYPP